MKRDIDKLEKLVEQLRTEIAHVRSTISQMGRLSSERRKRI